MQQIKFKRLKLLLLPLLCIFLAGCSVFAPVKNTPNKIYVLNTIDPTFYPTKPTHLTLLVTPPTANRAYATNQMLYTLKPYQVAYFTENRWADAPARMLLPLMVQALQNSGHFHAVIAPPYTGNYDLGLNTQLLMLQQDFLYHPSQIHLILRAQLLNNNTHRVIATHRFEIIQDAPQDNPYGGVIAANQAVAKLLSQLTDFCVRNSTSTK